MKKREAALMEKIDPEKMPRHVAIIMDGNGRWAKKRMMPRIFGHRAGVKTVDRILTLASEMKLQALTLYSFSKENWNRPPREVDSLMGILQKNLLKQLSRMVENNVKFNTIGHIENLPPHVLEAIEKVKEDTKNNTGTVLTLALSYGSQDEIIDAVRSLGQKMLDGELSPKDVTPELFEKHLYTANLPEVDLLIRTSGELRVSNFLLWQIAYAELYFSDLLWPDFTNNEFLEAIIEFQKRERRFGLVGEQIAEMEIKSRKQPDPDSKKTQNVF